jgi:signal transduction histidine kinase
MLSAVNCFLGQFNQVFVNIFANAIDALEESSQGQVYL